MTFYQDNFTCSFHLLLLQMTRVCNGGSSWDDCVGQPGELYNLSGTVTTSITITFTGTCAGHGRHGIREMELWGTRT